MNIDEISSRLVHLLREKRFLEAQQELFHENIISIEPDFHPKAKTEGLSNLQQKERAFLKNVRTWKDFKVSHPIVGANHFCIRMYSKLLTHHPSELEIDELIVYEVAGDKIVKEQFFYRAPVAKEAAD